MGRVIGASDIAQRPIEPAVRVGRVEPQHKHVVPLQVGCCICTNQAHTSCVADMLARVAPPHKHVAALQIGMHPHT